MRAVHPNLHQLHPYKFPYLEKWLLAAELGTVTLATVNGLLQYCLLGVKGGAGTRETAPFVIAHVIWSQEPRMESRLARVLAGNLYLG